MTLEEIKAAVDAGKTVCWSNEGYKVIKGKYEYLIVWRGENAIGLTHQDGVTMNGREDQFFILATDAPLRGREGNDDQLSGVLPTPVGQQQDGADPGLNLIEKHLSSGLPFA